MTSHADAPISFSVGGRSYAAPHELTFARQIAMRRLVQEAGLDHLQDLVHEGMSDTDVAEAIAAQALRSGRTLELLATALVPVGAAWSETQYAETRAHFAALTEPAEQQVLEAALAGFLFRFFATGRALSRISRSSSTSMERSAAARPAPTVASGVASPAASGAMSSGSSPATIPSGSG